MEGKDPIKVIKEAISRALVFYYPLAGRLREGCNRKLMVDCTDECVMFTEADANLKLDQLGDHEIQPPSPYLDQLLHSNDPSIIGRPLISFQNQWHARYAVSALLNIENGARPLPGESVVSDPSWVVPCLSEELVTSFSTSSSQVKAPSTAASLRRVALAWVPSLAASPTWQLFSLLSKTASFLIGFYDRNSLIVILFLKSISDSMLYRGTGSVCC
ncbi:hypothetical protein LWI28_012168 [Acer negundo]|uniref:Uncharacterized protein n=1 Tax=Acer negundo TaxID=4023 RepID=A0AAD5NX19_ACENE|nr:hypothetical protein LWI28_012168 [Acer negundo]